MNKLLKALIFDNQLTLSILETTDLVNDAIKIHHLSPVCSASLGRTLTACTFMSSNLKSEGDKLSVTIAGDGLGGKITVCGNKNLEMRGVIDNPNVDIPLKPNGKLDVSRCVGTNGRITITRSMGLKEPYSGSSKLVTGEIAEDFASYYANSEQTPTAMALGVKIGTDCTCIGAGGVVIQALPNADEINLKKAEEIINTFSNISTLIEEMGAEGVMKKFFGDIKFETYYPIYKCVCSKKYIEGVLVSLGKEELNNIIKEQGKITVNCQFCEKNYQFFQEDVDKLFK